MISLYTWDSCYCLYLYFLSFPVSIIVYISWNHSSYMTYILNLLPISKAAQKHFKNTEKSCSAKNSWIYTKLTANTVIFCFRDEDRDKFELFKSSSSEESMRRRASSSNDSVLSGASSSHSPLLGANPPWPPLLPPTGPPPITHEVLETTVWPTQSLCASLYL